MTDSALSHELKPLRDFCARFPGHRPGTKTHISTLIRFATVGVRAPDGGRVRLKATRFGARWFTTDEWFAAFLDALTTEPGPAESVPVWSPTQRRRESTASERKLLDRGS
jgi:hypothetical protein